jgi:hypothetical protein
MFDSASDLALETSDTPLGIDKDGLQRRTPFQEEKA